MAEGYDAADPERASTLALRDEWMLDGHHTQGRIIGGYGALIDYLTVECHHHAVEIRFGTTVTAVEESDKSALVLCANGDAHPADFVILTVPVALLNQIALPATERERIAAAAHIGFGNFIKILLRFDASWWTERRDLADLTFLCLTRGFQFGGLNVQPFCSTDRLVRRSEDGAMANLGEDKLTEVGLASIAEIFGVDPKQLSRRLVAARAINWAHDPYARGAYSYATPGTRVAQAVLSRFDGGKILFSGEALYSGRNMGTV